MMRCKLSQVAPVSIIILMLATFFGACRQEPDLPGPETKEYRAIVSAFYVGVAALQVGDDVRAEERLKAATQIVPEEPASWANLGLLALRQREFDAAAERLERARTHAPDNAQIQILLGQLESSRGKSAEAIKYFRRAVEIDSQNLIAMYALIGEIEREGGEQGEAEVLQTLDKMLAIQPDNLAVQLDVARLAAKRGDAEKLKQMIARFEQRSTAWPPEVREQVASLKEAATGPNPRLAASRVAFLRNVLARVSEFRQSVAAIKIPPETLGEPFTSFILLPTPAFRAAPPDETLSFNADQISEPSDAGQWAWVSFVSLTGEEAPATILANGKEVRVGGANLAFPGGNSAVPPAPDGVLGLDFDYDFKIDLALAGAGGFRLYRQERAGKYTDATARTGLPASVLNAAYGGAWAADLDSDGDLDLLLGASDGAPVALRNNGDATFKEMRPFESVIALRSFAWADLDADGDPDAALLDARGKLYVFANERTGQFRERSVPQQAGNIVALAIAEVSGDGLLDLVTLSGDGAIGRLSDKSEGRDWDAVEMIRLTNAPGKLSGETARLHIADLDNSGSLDLLVSAPGANNLWLGDADGKFKLASTQPAGRIFSSADLNGDGRLDLASLSDSGQPARLINRSAKNYHWQLVRPRAASATGDQRINSFGVGGEMELRAGFLVQKQIITGPVVHFGLGEQTGAEVVRVVWPNGSVRAEFDLTADQVVVAEQRLKGSCPSLFAFDGKEMRFVKDCAPWSPALGLKINAQDTMGILQTEEWTKIRGDQLAPRDGFYDLRITAELWETYYIDHYSLLAVDHPVGTEIYADERFAVPPPPLTVYAVKTPRPFARAVDDEGSDVTQTVAALDNNYLDNFGRGAYQGVTRDHYVELELDAGAPASGPLKLIAHGWLHPTDASVNVAISHGGLTPPRSLSIEVPDESGSWVTARANQGFPAGKNKIIVLDLEGIFRPSASRRLRLRTNMEIYWDQLAWAESLPASSIKETRINLESADLHYRGFSVMTQANASSPEVPVYRPIGGTAQRWRDLVGYYTRYGDIKPLLEKVDDRFVLVNAGDEMRFRFRALPPPPEGWTRDYIFIGDGWIKDGDLNSVFSKMVLPLPTHISNDYSRRPTRLEDDPVYQRHRDDWQNYHTRYVTPDNFRGALRSFSPRGQRTSPEKALAAPFASVSVK